MIIGAALPLKLIALPKTPNMKHLSAFVFALLFGCSTEREIQANLVEASLVKIEIVSRFPNNQQKLLTWLTPDQVRYITYEPIETTTFVGMSRTVMVRK